MSEQTIAGDESRLAPMDDSLPWPPEQDGEAEGSDQPEPEEVSDALLDQ